MTQDNLFDFDDSRVKNITPERPRDVTVRTMSYEISDSRKVRKALERKDWRELNRLGAVWYDQYGGKWHKFTPYFWDA